MTVSPRPASVDDRAVVLGPLSTAGLAAMLLGLRRRSGPAILAGGLLLGAGVRLTRFGTRSAGS